MEKTNGNAYLETRGNLLIVEDDPGIGRIVRDHLRRDNYSVTWATTGLECWEDFCSGEYDLVLVDLMLPEMDGFTLCKNIRLKSEVPLLITSARSEDESKVRAFGLGADDYITKPFSLTELSLRVEVHLRKYRKYQKDAEEKSPILTYYGGLTIDLVLKQAMVENEPIALTSKEWLLLMLLASHPGRQFSKSELYEHVWQQEAIDGGNTVTVHIKSLRMKLKDNIRDPKYIQTVWGSGYRFIGEPE
ncbi:transcriptional regulator [Paenibacillus sp. TCA20]|uniref:Response regulator transcription factor n=1 Tax=Paenibacillus urinalis TaxID=521520 RepID=A0AAX3MTX9_9BACL|nr:MULTISPECIES: response regulator transcription factor [Paenibacillus]WDH80848.1 response regulator transcription factor [Paenibacillus urinalis]GAK39222.1 transcriptional regulator [Paenibacillus sp. TCA20]